MSFILTEEQEELLALVRKFSEKEILPYAHQMDVEAHFVPGLIQKIADLGFMGINVPEEYGGVGADEVTFLDITATHEGRSTFARLVEKSAKELFVPLTVGG